MQHRPTHICTATALARAIFIAALAVACLGMASPALAAKAKAAKSTKAANAAKVAAAAAAAKSPQVIAMETDFGTKVADYVAITRELQRTQAEVDQVTSQIASQSAKVQVARSALASRAVEAYRMEDVGIIESIFTARSLRDLVTRMNYLTLITEHDARMLQDLRLAQTEETWLQESYVLRLADLERLQAKADKQQAQLLAALAAEQARAAALGAAFDPTPASTGAAASTGGSTALPTGATPPKDGFNKSLVVSANNFRGGKALTVEQIQAFLDRQPGALKSYRGTDHFGQTKTAAQMISDASVRFNINPKIILATLQKEQSLLTTKNPSQKQYNGAMGAGMPDSGNNALQMQGFGNQIYWGAQKFNKNALDWHMGSYEPVDGTKVYAQNEGTFAQYRYTPHFSGVMSFWTIFWRHFGDPTK